MALRRGMGIVRALVLTGLALVVIFIAYRARRAFIPFLIAVAISYLIRPFVMMVESRGAQRTAAIFTVYLLATAFIGYSLLFVLPPLAAQLDDIVRTFSSTSDLGLWIDAADRSREEPGAGYEATVEDDREKEGQHSIGLDRLVREWGRKVSFLSEGTSTRMAEAAVTGVESYIREFAAATRRVVSVLISHLPSIMIAPVIAFYFTRDVEEMKERFASWLPPDSRDRIMGAISDIDGALAGWIRGQAIVCTFVGVATGVSLALLKVKYALPIGLLVGILEIIPYFGPLFGMIPAVLMAAQRSTLTAILAALVFTSIQQVESAIISPKIVGECVGLHPLAVIGALLVGGALFGVMGILLAVPVAAVLFILGERLLFSAD